jgi:isopenicillin N synthase-like dioxygenase
MRLPINLIHAGENVGFFTLITHGLPKQIIESMFAISKSFFELPNDVEATVPWSLDNVGWG